MKNNDKPTVDLNGLINIAGLPQRDVFVIRKKLSHIKEKKTISDWIELLKTAGVFQKTPESLVKLKV